MFVGNVTKTSAQLPTQIGQPEHAPSPARDRALAWLESISVVYVVCPVVLFFDLWMRPYYGIPLHILAIAGAAMTIRDAWTYSGTHHSLGRSFTSHRGKVAHLVVIALVIFLVVCSPLGFSEYWRGLDYRKHLAFLHVLTTQEFPIHIPDLGYLATHVGLYLPASFIGRITSSWSAACVGLLLWTAIGIYLAVLWLIQLSGRLSILFVIIFLGFGGLDMLAAVFFGLSPSGPVPGYWPYYLSIVPGSPLHGMFWLYVSNTEYLFVSAHHLLPGVILLFMFLVAALQKKSSRGLFFLYSVMPISSVFAMIGLFPYLLFSLARTGLRSVFNVRDLVAAPAVFIASALFILSNNGDVPMGPIWEVQNLYETLPIYLITMTVEVGIFVYLAHNVSERGLSASERSMILIACGSIVAFSLWRFGQYSDFTTKTSYPSQIVLLLCYFRIVDKATGHAELRRARILMLLLMVGCWSALHVIVAGANGVVGSMSHSPDFSIREMLDPIASESKQLSDANAFFWKHLARRRHDASD